MSEILWFTLYVGLIDQKIKKICNAYLFIMWLTLHTIILTYPTNISKHLSF